MASRIGQHIQQRRAFASPEQEAMIGVRMVAARILAPWERFLKSEADLSTSQYNVLRILRGSHPKSLTAGEIGERTIIGHVGPRKLRALSRLLAELLDGMGTYP